MCVNSATRQGYIYGIVRWYTKWGRRRREREREKEKEERKEDKEVIQIDCDSAKRERERRIKKKTEGKKRVGFSFFQAKEA